MRRVEQRTSGPMLLVQAPSGVVIAMAGWMFDPFHCAGMTSGSPRVDVMAPIELARLLSEGDNSAQFRSDVVIVPQTQDGTPQAAGRGAGSASSRFIPGPGSP